MPNSKQIVYLSQAQYQELITNQSITVNGVTVTYDENDIYVTPQAEPVTDVRINGTSIAANGIANVPVVGNEINGVGKTVGMVRFKDGYCYGFKTFLNGNDYCLAIKAATESGIKTGKVQNANGYGVIDSTNINAATFYGLAKVAGHDEASSTEPVGTYTPEAKGAIQSMLGISDLIATAENNLIASKAYAIGDVFTANGKLYKATAAIAADAAIIPAAEGEEIVGANCEETSVDEGFVKFTDYATATTPGIGTVNGYGIGIRNDNHSFTIVAASDNSIKNGNGWFSPIATINQHKATFYGLAKAAGDTTQAASDNAIGTYTDDAKSAIRTMLGAVGSEDYATSSVAGVVKLGNGITASGGALVLANPTDNDYKTGGTNIKAVVPSQQHKSVFYGLAKASGDTTQSSSSNAVGVYTDNAKASIKSMLGIQDGSTGTVNVSGATPTITAVENTRYVCGEVTSLSFTPAASGICIVRFTSGSTVTVLTLPNTVKFPEWFDPTSLETNTIYEICITDGVYGAVMSWAL